MTRRELEIYAERVTNQYDKLRQLLTALARDKGDLVISRSLVDDQDSEGWGIECIPSEAGESVTVRAVQQTPEPALVLQ